MKINKFRNLSIRKQLLSSYVAIIIIPIILLSGIIFFYSKSFLESNVSNSFQIVDSQITRNLDTFFNSMAKISEILFYSDDVLDILSKDYSKMDFPEYYKIRAHSKIIDEVFKNMFLMNNYIDSLDLYPHNYDWIYTKGFNQSLNYEYSPKNKEWYKNIISADGKEVIIGVHKKLQVTPHENYVVTVGRNIKAPSDERSLVGFLINIRVDTLKNLYEQVTVSKNSKQLIIDENNNIVYSNDIK